MSMTQTQRTTAARDATMNEIKSIHTILQNARDQLVSIKLSRYYKSSFNLPVWNLNCAIWKTQNALESLDGLLQAINYTDMEDVEDGQAGTSENEEARNIRST
jgi:hypothetical protein